mmetsp:Transcript_26857/g.63102  ORF Transcript_26857/g.63102 Transcript_26857/m.63102 type:complete len:84 (+) Transcript_26857:1550-1801(+)
MPSQLLRKVKIDSFQQQTMRLTLNHAVHSAEGFDVISSVGDSFSVCSSASSIFKLLNTSIHCMTSSSFGSRPFFFNEEFDQLI